eukprot:363733-Chlamydomonas_euryale.AAC.2
MVLLAAFVMRVPPGPVIVISFRTVCENAVSLPPIHPSDHAFTHFVHPSQRITSCGRHIPSSTARCPLDSTSHRHRLSPAFPCLPLLPRTPPQVAQLQCQLEQTQEELASLTYQAELAQKRLTRADKLTGALADESVRWQVGGEEVVCVQGGFTATADQRTGGQGRARQLTSALVDEGARWQRQLTSALVDEGARWQGGCTATADQRTGGQGRAVAGKRVWRAVVWRAGLQRQLTSALVDEGARWQVSGCGGRDFEGRVYSDS